MNWIVFTFAWNEACAACLVLTGNEMEWILVLSSLFVFSFFICKMHASFTAQFAIHCCNIYRDEVDLNCWLQLFIYTRLKQHQKELSSVALAQACCIVTQAQLASHFETHLQLLFGVNDFIFVISLISDDCSVLWWDLAVALHVEECGVLWPNINYFKWENSLLLTIRLQAEMHWDTPSVTN